jgi:hypothetical protein
MELPRLSSFSGVAFTNKSQLGQFRIEAINGCGTALKFYSDSSNNGGNCRVQFGSIASCTQAIEFNGGSGGYMQGIRIDGQFITETDNIVLFSGTSIPFDGQHVNVGSIDIVDGGGYVLRNTTGGTINRFTLTVPNWFGGSGFDAGTPTQIAKSDELWYDCVFDLCNNRVFTQAHLTPGGITGSRWKMRGHTSKGGAIEMSTVTSLDSTFNSGNMMYSSEFMLKMTLASGLAAGAAVSRYFYHILADVSYYSWEVIAGEGGAVVEYVQNAASGRVIVGIRNISASALSAGAVVYLAVRRK